MSIAGIAARSELLLQTNKFKLIIKNIIFYLLIAIMCLFSIFSWTNQLNLSPDSTNYLSAAQHLSSKGEFEISVNWPSQKMRPQPEPYTEFPPGLPLLASAFILACGDVILSAAIVQSLAILMFYIALFRLMGLLGLSRRFRIGVFAVFSFFPAYRIIFTTFWTETIFLSLLFLLLIINYRIITSKHEKYWVYAYILLFLASSFKYIGVFNAFLFALPVISLAGGNRIIKAINIILFSTLPAIIWFLRNSILYGSISLSHKIGNKVSFNFVDFVVNYFEPLPLFAVIGGIIVLVWICYLIISTAFSKINLQKDKRYFVRNLLVIILVNISALAFFMIASHIDPPNFRMMSTTLTLSLLALFICIHIIYSDKPQKFGSRILAKVPYIIAIVSLMSIKYPVCPNPAAINYPAEKELWEDIDSLGIAGKATHFYSGYYFNHQLYAGRPQLMLWQSNMSDTVYAKEILEIGESPFFVLRDNDVWYANLDKYYTDLGMEKYYRKDLGYAVYYLKD